MQKWLDISGLKIHREKHIDEANLREHGVYQFLKDRKVLNANLYPENYVDAIIRNFFANLHPNLDNENSSQFGKFFLRSKVLRINPSLINKVLGLPNVDDDGVLADRDDIAKVLSNNVVKKWPTKKDEHFLASSLTSLFSVLHKLCIFNWLPTKNEQYVTLEQARVLHKLGLNRKLNFGRLIFRHLATWGKKKSISYLPYPSLIFQVIKSQNFPLMDSDEYTHELDYYRVDSLLTKKGKGGIRYTGDLPWDKSKDIILSGSSVPSQGVGKGATSDCPSSIPSSPSMFAGINAEMMASVSHLLGTDSPSIPKTTVLAFLEKQNVILGRIVQDWTLLKDNTASFVNLISSQSGGGAGTSAGTSAATDVADAAGVDRTTRGVAEDAGTSAGEDEQEEEDEETEEE